MKKNVLILIALGCTACANKVTTLNNKVQESNMINCYELVKSVSNNQKIFYKIKDEFAKNPGEKELRHLYLLDQYIPLNNQGCSGNTVKIKKIETERFLFTDTSVNKYGIQITAEISLINKTGLVTNKELKSRVIGDFHRTITLTKKKVDKIVMSLLLKAFSDLDQQITKI